MRLVRWLMAAIVVQHSKTASWAGRGTLWTWDAERLLVAPALHHGEILAIGLAALPGQVRPDMVEAQRAGARLGAALAGWSAPLLRELAPV